MADPEENFGGLEAIINNHRLYIDRLKISAEADRKEANPYFIRGALYSIGAIVATASTVINEVQTSESFSDLTSSNGVLFAVSALATTVLAGRNINKGSAFDSSVYKKLQLAEQMQKKVEFFEKF